MIVSEKVNDSFRVITRGAVCFIESLTNVNHDSINFQVETTRLILSLLPFVYNDLTKVTHYETFSPA